jgi:hypothetical protein
VRVRGVLFFLAVTFAVLLPCSAQPSTALARYRQQLGVEHFGVPFPSSQDPEAWRQWREQVQARLKARRQLLHANNVSGTASGIIETIAGAAPFQAPVDALQTGFGRLGGIAEDSSGNLYVASCDLGVILKIDGSANTTVYAGQPLPDAPAAAAGDGGPATEARLPCPFGIAVDRSDNVYVSDIDSYTVREIDAGTGIIHTIAGVVGDSGHSGDGGPATSAELEYPTGLALDGAGNLFIADLRYIRKLDLASGVIQTLAGTEETPQCQLTASSTCPGGQVSFSLFGQIITFAKGLLYAAPLYLSVGSQSAGGGIISINPATGAVQLLAGGGFEAGSSSSYPGIGLFLNPQGIAADAAGNVYITGFNQAPAGTGSLNSPSFPMVEELQVSDNSMHVVAGTAPAPFNYAGDGGPAIKAQLHSPASICTSPTGKLVFVDTFNIRSFSVGGNITTIAGNGSPNFFGDGTGAQHAGLGQPLGVTADAQGNIYIADTENGRVRKVDGATGVITTIAGKGTLYGGAGDGGPALQAALFPTDVALDHSNHLYIRDYGYGLRVVDLTSGTISTLLPNVASEGQMLFDGDHTLYIGAPHEASAFPTLSANDQVWAVDLSTGATSVLAGQSQSSSDLPSGDGGPATEASLGNVAGLALDGQGHLFVADAGYSDVRQIDLGTGIISTLAGSHSDAGFVRGYSGDGGPATAAELNVPFGLAYDGAGHLTIVDADNHVLRQVDLASGIITTIAGNHAPGFGGDGSASTQAMLFYPAAVAYDPAGNLLIADEQNDRIRRVVLHPTKLKTMLAFSSGDSTTLTATYSGLSFGIAPTGNVTFSRGNMTLGTANPEPANDGSGNYIATLNAAPAGETITAQYSGDANYASVTATAAFQPVTPSYTVSANPASLTIRQGSSGSVTFTVTPQNGFDQAVNFGCESKTLPKDVTCSFSPASVTPNGSSAVITKLTVQTAGTGAAARSSGKPLSEWFGGGTALALMLLGMPRICRRAWLNGSLCLLCMLCFAGGVLGCGGGSSNGSGGSTQNANATPPGSYSIEVTTSAGTADQTAPVTVSLTVTE